MVILISGSSFNFNGYLICRVIFGSLKNWTKLIVAKLMPIFTQTQRKLHDISLIHPFLEKISVKIQLHHLFCVNFWSFYFWVLKLKLSQMSIPIPNFTYFSSTYKFHRRGDKNLGETFPNTLKPIKA